MIEPVKCPSTRFPAKGRRAIWLVVSLALAALVFAAGAQAQGTNATADATLSEAAAESGVPSAQAESTTEQTPLAGETTPPTVEQAPATAEEPGPVAEPAPPAATEAAAATTEQTPPAAETTPPATEITPPPTEQAQSATGESPSTAEQAAPVATEAAPPTTEAAPPPTEQTLPLAEATPPTLEHVPAVTETGPPGEIEQTSGGADSEGLANQRTGENSQASPGDSAPAHDDVGEAAPAATTSITPSVLSEIPTTHDQTSLASPPRTVPARRPEQANCESAAPGASFAACGDVSWLSLVATASASTTSFTAGYTPPTANTGGAPAGRQGGGSTVENHPSAPTPGPAPGGAGGGSAAGGGSGSASSASFTLVGSLLHAAPRATRRFRLAQQSWRTSFFVLVAERPD
jgi:hypothetical protein